MQEAEQHLAGIVLNIKNLLHRREGKLHNPKGQQPLNEEKLHRLKDRPLQKGRTDQRNAKAELRIHNQQAEAQHVKRIHRHHLLPRKTRGEKVGIEDNVRLVIIQKPCII